MAARDDSLVVRQILQAIHARDSLLSLRDLENPSALGRRAGGEHTTPVPSYSETPAEGHTSVPAGATDQVPAHGGDTPPPYNPPAGGAPAGGAAPAPAPPAGGSRPPAGGPVPAGSNQFGSAINDAFRGYEE